MTSATFRQHRHSVLVIGASYGLLPAAKIAAAGHHVTVVGRAEEVSTIITDGVAIEFSAKKILRPPLGKNGLSFCVPSAVNPDDFDIAFLAIQEPQAKAPELRALLARIGDSLPVASIMNMPPPPFLARIPNLPADIDRDAYQCPDAWAPLPMDRLTLASADPQVFRPDARRPGHLRVTLASNFKFAPFVRPEDQTILERIARDASRAQQPWGRPPVHLLARGSIFTPLSKWPMLVTGNCRCVTEYGVPLSIREAVHSDPASSRLLFEEVNHCLKAIGAPPASLVSYDAYAQAAARLTRPSSLANGIAAGVTAVERIDLLVLGLLHSQSADTRAIEIMATVSTRITTALGRTTS
jgi:hypothetical protein